ncbi:beta-lactamase family protein [Chitinophaga ginsengisegetis]|uniref:serine hydrolase domain-containing protein n=1 Tax=Chitinophaga ginsengisegetis TaxID=393003 RepID=UPI0034429B06
MKQFIPAFLLCLSTLLTQAQVTTDNLHKTKVDSLVQSALSVFMQNNARVSAEVGVYTGGQTYIYRYSKTTLPAPNTPYEIGSVSKTFTGYLLAKAVTAKKVKLDDDIRFYLNGDYPNLQYKGRAIQLKHLIAHVSGLPFMLPDRRDLFQRPDDSIPGVIDSLQHDYSMGAFLNDLHQVQLDTVPGYHFKYSNAGAQLLGFILERIYGMSYAELVRKYITRPQHMKYTTASLPDDAAKGYNQQGRIMPYNPPMLLAAGGIYSSVADMLQYIRLHTDESNPVVKLTHQPAWGDINSYAMGLSWQMNKTGNGIRRIWQSGGTFGFSSYCVVYPEKNTGIVILTNEADRTAQDALSVAAGKIFEGLE